MKRMLTIRVEIRGASGTAWGEVDVQEDLLDCNRRHDEAIEFLTGEARIAAYAAAQKYETHMKELR